MFFKKYQIKSKNIDIMGISMLIAGFMFFVPILALYLEKNLFSITNVAIIFSVQAITSIVFEVPTGAIADLFGRKKTYIASIILWLTGLFLLYIGGSFTMFILFAILWGIAGALMSGTDSAIIYDTLKDEKKEHHYKKIIGTFYALWPLGAIVGSVAGGYFARISLTLPIALSLIPLGTVFFLTLFLKEPKYEQEEEKNIWKHTWVSTKYALGHKQILYLMVIGLIVLAFGETAHNLKPLFLEFKMIPIEYFGWVFGATFALSSFGHYFSDTVSDRIGDKNTIILSTITFPLLLVFAALTHGLISMGFLVLTSIPFGLRNPVIDDMINKEISSSKRATIISISALMGKIGIAIGGPFLGYFADLYSINAAFILAGVLMSSAVIFSFLIKEKLI